MWARAQVSGTVTYVRDGCPPLGGVLGFDGLVAYVLPMARGGAGERKDSTPSPTTVINVARMTPKEATAVNILLG